MSVDSGNLSSPSWTFLLPRHTQTLGTDCSDDSGGGYEKMLGILYKKQCIMVYKQMVLRPRDIAWLYFNARLGQSTMQPAELIHHKPCKIFSLRCLLYLDCAASAVTNCNSILQTVALISFLPQGGCRGGTMICRKEVPLPPPPPPPSHHHPHSVCKGMEKKCSPRRHSIPFSFVSRCSVTK